MGNEKSVLALSGEVDLVSAPGSRREIATMLDRKPSELLIDLAQVTFIGSRGLGLLVEARLRADAQNTRAVLRAPSPSVDRLLVHQRHQEIVLADRS